MRILHGLEADQRTEEAFEKPRAHMIDDAEVVAKVPNLTAPISVRLSSPLLKRLDRLAEKEGRTRSNLMQRILWEYIRMQKD